MDQEVPPASRPHNEIAEAAWRAARAKRAAKQRSVEGAARRKAMTLHERHLYWEEIHPVEPPYSSP